MARNLVREKDEKDIIPLELPTLPPSPPKVEETVRIITFENLIASNLEALNNKFDLLIKRVYEGFLQVGVKFPEDSA